MPNRSNSSPLGKNSKMSNMIEQTRHRLYLRRLAILFILLAVATIVFIAENKDVSEIYINKYSKEYIARLEIKGFISDNRKLYKLVDKIANNNKIKAVILDIDSPGGSAVGGERLYKELKYLAEKKPLVASIRSMGASAGYMVALPAHKIYAMEGSIVGSIGVILQAMEFTGMLDKLGVKPIIVKSGKYKDSFSPFSKFNKDKIRESQKMIDGFYSYFVGLVMENRKISKRKVMKIADGRIFSGTQSVNNRLIDEIGGEREILTWLAKEKNISGLKVKDVKLRPKKKFSYFDKIDQSSVLLYLLGKIIPIEHFTNTEILIS